MSNTFIISCYADMRGGYTRNYHNRGYNTIAATPLFLDKTILITYIKMHIVICVLGLLNKLFKRYKTPL